ncbi:methionine--tRNA ligase [Campylobacter sp. 19-13652]|uniref:methionine--tRNA ligase n=1 Tax=Campylobacter sp. 19-13652 TaxID=2840180 RepID=UPI001C79641F|nr:methionine--tRNA ligase [Campylobacter sp. 19-13652]BCX79031.1 methionine--tRNA ligase [Campylobacter sp. 19-13652]
MDKFYVTTPIYYVNDVPHIGHAYSTIIADTIARYHRLNGAETYFMTGTDEHGQKIEQAAANKGKSPKQYADEISAKFKELWDEFEISYDYFIRTTDESHKLTAQLAFEKMYEKGDIYKGEYEGFYCVSCETFFTQTQLLDGGCCPDCGRPTTVVKEESYFFALSKYEDALLKWYEENDECIVPKGKKNEVVSFVKGGLKDLSITRTSFDWGVKLPKSLNEPKHVMYVWLDALINYLTTLGYAQNDAKMRFWDYTTHIVGKDILRFHAVYWPAFLLSLGLPLPKRIAAHGWWTKDGEKMSKSKGNVVNPHLAAQTYGLEAFRYFLLREVPFGQDGDFSERALVERINSELANGLGNLLSRTVGMSAKYSDYEIKQSGARELYNAELNEAKTHINAALSSLEGLSTNRYLEEIFKIVALANTAIAKYEPWNLIKQGEKDKANALVALCANLLSRIALLLAPAMPRTADKIATTLGFSIDTNSFNRLILKDELISFKASQTAALFEKVEDKQAFSPATTVQAEPQNEEQADEISIDEFAKCLIKAGTVLECEAVEGSEKLLKFKIDLGEKEPRQILSGIAKYYTPNELIGKQVCVLANLKPRKIMKQLSQGMILSAKDDDGKLTLLSTPTKVQNGAIIG